MTKIQTKKEIIKKINQLNKKIDIKIITEKDWKKESAEHQKLVWALKRLA